MWTIEICPGEIKPEKWELVASVKYMDLISPITAYLERVAKAYSLERHIRITSPDKHLVSVDGIYTVN